MTNPFEVALPNVRLGNGLDAVGMAGTGNSAQAPTGDGCAPVGIAADLPACCHASLNDPIQKRLYAAYNTAGERKGLNYQGLPCPTWEQLPVDIQEKWLAVVEMAEEILLSDPVCRVCGCSDSIPCDGGCYWVPDPDGGNLCSCCARGLYGDRMVVTPDDGDVGWVVLDLETDTYLGDEDGEIIYSIREDAERVARTGIVERMDIDRDNDCNADPEADTADYPPSSNPLEVNRA